MQLITLELRADGEHTMAEKPDKVLKRLLRPAWGAFDISMFLAIICASEFYNGTSPKGYLLTMAIAALVAVMTLSFWSIYRVTRYFRQQQRQYS